MRLLHLDGSTKTPKWTWFIDQVPPYAILSHTWADDEPTFEDLITGTAWKKTGYKKIMFCGEQAARDGIEHFWVDTCCIDKWDLEEVSSATNSMFRWYQNAEKCYVYLSDVPSPGVGNNDDWETFFRNSRWWKRGWTLQELIAPPSLEFFSSQCQRLGDKKELEQRICAITSIPIDAFGGHLEKFSMEERISWVSHRETKEEEDMIYFLIGLCSVNVPAYYGEGKETTKWRLRSEISGLDDEYITSQALFMVPFKQNDQFTGRESQLSTLEKLLFAEQSTTKITITGTSGIGKTQLATEPAYRTRKKHPNCSVFWVAATDMASLHQSYRHIAQRLEISGWDDQAADVKTLVKVHLSQAIAGQWLLIFDGVDTNQWTADYLPNSERGTILFTTISREDAVRLSPANIVEIPEGDRRVARQMLQALLPRLDLISEQQYADMMIEELDGLPLAIVLAASYIRANHKTVQDYVLLLTERSDTKFHVPNEDSEDEHLYIQKSVTVVCLISLNDIECQNELAAQYLSFMACVDSKDIPQALLPEDGMYEDQSDAIETLTKYSIVTKRPTGRSLDMHRLVHLTTQRWLCMRKMSDYWAHKAAARLIETLPHHNHNSLSKERRLLPHATYIATSKLLKKDDETKSLLVHRCAMALDSQGRYSECEAFSVELVEILKDKLGADHPDTLISISSLASTYSRQGRYEAAEQLEVQVLESRKNRLGADHDYTLLSIGNLAAIYSCQRRWDEAEQLEVQVLERCKKLLGIDHPATRNSMNSLGLIYYHQGRWETAEKLVVQVLDSRKNKLGADHPSTLVSMTNLASIYSRQGRWEMAEQLEVQVLEIRKKKLGADHPSTLTIMNNLAFTLERRGRHMEAISLMRDCVQRRQCVLGDSHPDFRSSFEALIGWAADVTDVTP